MLVGEEVGIQRGIIDAEVISEGAFGVCWSLLSTR